MNSKEFRQLTGWVDYDRSKLSRLTYKQKVKWFRLRLNKTLIKPLRYVYRGLSRSPQQSTLLILATSVCCAIEALGKFCTGGKVGNHARFTAFLKDFMDKSYLTCTIQGKTYEYILWHYFRNGLAHGFTIRHGGFEHKPNKPEYFREEQNNLIIDPKFFLDDFFGGIQKYLDALERASDSDLIARKFQKVFEDVFIKGK